MQLPGYSARDGLLPWGRWGRDIEVGCRSGKRSGHMSEHPGSTLPQTADPDSVATHLPPRVGA